MLESWEYCQKCVQYHAPNNHLPLFQVWDTDGAGLKDFKPDIGEFRAVDAQAAAEKWAGDDDQTSAEYRIVRGDYSPTLAVRKIDWPEGKVVLYSVIGESVPQYTAHFKSEQKV